MIGYTMVGTKEIKISGTLYDNILGVLGAKRSMDHDNFIV
jgi:hypothetical protein